MKPKHLAEALYTVAAEIRDHVAAGEYDAALEKLDELANKVEFGASLACQLRRKLWQCKREAAEVQAHLHEPTQPVVMVRDGRAA